MAVNVRIDVVQFGDPQRALKSALYKLRKATSPVLRKVREKEYFVSESRKRRAESRQAIRERSQV